MSLTEGNTLISWNDVQNSGKIAGSEWACPVGPTTIEDLGTLEASDVQVTDDDILWLGGQWQHLELLTYPEGYQAAQIVDSESGNVLTGPRYASRYAGAISCQGCGFSNEPVTALAVDGVRTLPLHDGKEIRLIQNIYNSTETVIASAGRLNANRVMIAPQRSELWLKVLGTFTALDNEESWGTFQFYIAEEQGQANGCLTIGISSRRYGWNIGGITCDLNHEGQIESMRVDRSLVLSNLGVNREVDIDEDELATINDAQERNFILDALAERLGYGKWLGLDLRLSALGLYKALGESKPELGRVISCK